MTKPLDDKIRREKETVELMVTLNCKGHHHDDTVPCPACRELIEYAHARVDACPHMEHKTFCSSCETHCYAPEMRERIREAMRYAGPRMIFHHPVMAFRHLMDGRG